jgi:hypothetical protein
VICYEGIFARDHWRQLTAHPWWYREAPDIERQLLWRWDALSKIGQDWFHLPSFYAEEQRRCLTLEARPEGIFRIDRCTGGEVRLEEPTVGGWTHEGSLASIHPQHLAETVDEIDELIPTAPDRMSDPSRDDLATELLKEFGELLFPLSHVSTPLWNCYYLWGFEGMMVMIARRPELVAHACQRFLLLALSTVREAARRGVAGFWIEDCFTDMISPEAFESLNLRFLRPLVEEIRAKGMASIHYFCGNPAGKWPLLLSTGADAIALEEGKKGFDIDIEDVVGRVAGRMTVLGNLDAIGVLQDGSEDALRSEIARQIAAGRRNGSRFVMSIGSPVTPATPVERVRLYCELAHEIGGS